MLYPEVRGRACSIVGLRPLFFCCEQGMGITGESEGWGEMTPSLSQTWLGSLLLLVCLLASRSITEEVSEYCSHMIGSGHLQSLQRLVSAWPCCILPSLHWGNGGRSQGAGQREQLQAGK